MTYEEAIKIRNEILKDSIRARLYRRDPIKFAEFKYAGRIAPPYKLAEIWMMVNTIAKHKRGGRDLFEEDDKFYEAVKKRIKP